VRLNGVTRTRLDWRCSAREGSHSWRHPGLNSLLLLLLLKLLLLLLQFLQELFGRFHVLLSIWLLLVVSTSLIVALVSLVGLIVGLRVIGRVG
jgi:hypothetical protein